MTQFACLLSDDKSTGVSGRGNKKVFACSCLLVVVWIMICWNPDFFNDPLIFRYLDLCKQCRPRSDCSDSTLFAMSSASFGGITVSVC